MCIVLSIIVISLALSAGEQTRERGVDMSTADSVSFYASHIGSSSQMAKSQTKNFTPVEGRDFGSRLDAARAMGRSSGQRLFWIGYGFDIKPGIGIDVAIPNTQISSAVVTSSDGRYETENVGVFLLQEAGSGQIVDVELYNLDRPHDYRGMPVFWLGRSKSDESLNFLSSLFRSTDSSQIGERLTNAIGTHNDPMAGPLLKEIVQHSTWEGARDAAVLWMGHIPGTRDFLAGIVLNNQESSRVRERAASSIGVAKDAAALATLKDLYQAIANPEVKIRIIEAISMMKKDENAKGFLEKVARDESDHRLKAEAAARLGWIPSSDTSRFDLSETADAQSAHKDSDTFSNLRDGYEAISNPGQKQRYLEASAHLKNKGGVAKLLVDVGETEPVAAVRQKAIYLLGSIVGKLVLASPRNVKQVADIRTDLPGRDLESVSRLPKDEAIPLLIGIARSHPEPQVRYEAILHLARSGDDRALQYFKEFVLR